MRIRLVFVAAAALALFWAPARAEKPRLAVLIVVDQFPSGHLERMPAGGRLEKAMNRGAVFRRAFFDHVPTETAPGHATIATGRAPGVHGIIGNEAYDRSRAKSYAAVEDPEKGIGPHRLEVPTLADALRKESPGARIVSISGKDRSAIFLGGRAADVVLWLNKKKKGFVTSAFYGDPPAWVEAVNAGLPPIELAVRPPFTKKDAFTSPASDRAVLAAAKIAIKAERLGADDTPDLLNVSFSATDWIGHRWGPDSPQMAAQLEELDAILGDLFDAAEAAAPGRVLYAFTSDHGILPVPGSDAGRKLKARRVNSRDFIQRIERRLQAARPLGRTPWIAEFNAPDLYLSRELSIGATADWKKWTREAAAVIAMEPEVAAVYIPGQRSTNDPFADVYRRSFAPGRSGDLQIRLKPGVLLSRWPSGTSHGSPYPYDAQVPVLLWGAGVLPGGHDSRISVESLAPTLAVALEVDLPPDDGRALLEAFPPAQRRR